MARGSLLALVVAMVSLIGAAQADVGVARSHAVRNGSTSAVLLDPENVQTSSSGRNGSRDFKDGHPRSTLSSSSAAVRNLRVCAYPEYSYRFGCTKDERTLILISNKLACTADLIVTRPTLLRLRMTFNGVLQYLSSPYLINPGSYTWSVWIFIRIGLPLPAGQWGCEFSLGHSRLGATFRSGGPTGPVVDTAACSVDHTYAFESTRVCQTDDSSQPIPSSTRLVCSGIFAGQTGLNASLALVTSEGSPVGSSYSFSPGAPVWQAITIFVPQTPGNYICRYSVDGTALADKPLTIG